MFFVIASLELFGGHFYKVLFSLTKTYVCYFCRLKENMLLDVSTVNGYRWN